MIIDGLRFFSAEAWMEIAADVKPHKEGLTEDTMQHPCELICVNDKGVRTNQIDQ